MPGLLVWDSFRTHATGNIKKKLKQMKPDAVIIPGGLTTPMVQLLDVSSNQPFKNSVKKQWTTCGWTVGSIHLHLGV